MYIVILITVPKRQEAKKIAQRLVAEKLAACVNIVNTVESIFTWQKKVEKTSEALLVVKSKKALLASIIRRVKSLHSYTVPEIIALPILGGYRPYLRWIDESVR